MGTHISFVRSITMDSWDEKQLAKMKMGGNQQCHDFLAKYGVDVSKASPDDKVEKRTKIRQRYDSRAGELYRQVLRARIEGKDEPTELPPERVEKSPDDVPFEKKKMQGFGSGPTPSQIRSKERSDRRKRLAAIGVGVSSAAVAIVAWGLSKRKSRGGGSGAVEQ